MRRPDVVPGSGSCVELVDLEFQENHPDLWDFLTCRVWEDGKPRETGSLLIVCDELHLKAMLNDRDLKRQIWVSGVSFSGLLQNVQTLLEQPSPDWRKAKDWGGGKGKK